MFDIENIRIHECISSKCKHCKTGQSTGMDGFGFPRPTSVYFCNLTVSERYYDCPLFRRDVDRITDIIRFEVKQVTCRNGKNIKKFGWHIFDNDYGHLVEVIDTFDFEDKDKIDKLCAWLNKLDESTGYFLGENSVDE